MKSLSLYQITQKANKAFILDPSDCTVKIYMLTTHDDPEVVNLCQLCKLCSFAMSVWLQFV